MILSVIRSRNVDCLLEVATDRVPFFWMLTMDRGPERAYTQLVERYRKHPEIWSPNSRTGLQQFVPSLATCRILWKDVLQFVRSEHERIWSELNARTGFAS